MMSDCFLFIHFLEILVPQSFYYLESFDSFGGYGDSDYLIVYVDFEYHDDPENCFGLEDFVNLFNKICRLDEIFLSSTKLVDV